MRYIPTTEFRLPAVDQRLTSIDRGRTGAFYAESMRHNLELIRRQFAPNLKWAKAYFCSYEHHHHSNQHEDHRHLKSPVGSPVCHAQVARCFIGALLALDCPDMPRDDFLRGVMDAVNNPSGDSEYLYGDAGLLYCLRILAHHYGSDGSAGELKTCIRVLVGRILDTGRSHAIQWFSNSTDTDRSPLLWEWHGKHYLGAAHGTAGILYQLLRCREYLHAADLADIELTIHWMIQKQQQTANGNLPSSLESSSRLPTLVQFCHGAPGLVLLLSEAVNVFQSHHETLITALKNAMQCVAENGLLTKGVGLCHGIAGNAFALMHGNAVLNNVYFEQMLMRTLPCHGLIEQGKTSCGCLTIRGHCLRDPLFYHCCMMHCVKEI